MFGGRGGDRNGASLFGVDSARGGESPDGPGRERDGDRSRRLWRRVVSGRNGAPVEGDFSEACGLVDRLQAEVARLFIATGGDSATEDDARVAALVRAAVERVGRLWADLHLARAGTYFARREGGGKA